MAKITPKQVKTYWEDEALAVLTRTMVSGKYSDLTIKCNNRSFQVHRHIVCPQSKFFETACDGLFKEASSGEVTLPDDDPVLIKKMVTFLYNGTYSDQHGEEDWENLSHKSWEAEKINAEPSRQPTWRDNLPVPAHFSKSLQTTASYTNCSLSTDNPQSKPEETSCPSKKPSKQELTYTSTQDDPEDRLQYSSFVVNVRMWALADKYDIKILKRLALTYFKERVDQSDWDFPNFCLAARELYQLPSSISRSFRDLVVERAANVRKALYDWNEFHELMNDVPEFTRDLLLCMWAQTDENERRTKLAEFARLKKT